MTSARRSFISHYEEHRKSIFNYLLYRLNFDRGLAEDLTSEVFLKAYEHFDSYNQQYPFRPWIFTIAHRHLISYFQSRKKPNLPIEEAEKITAHIPYHEKFDHDSLLKKIMKLLKKLPEAQQEIVTLRFINDLSYEEISGITGKDEGALRTSLSRALSTLREQYHIHFSEETL